MAWRNRLVIPALMGVGFLWLLGLMIWGEHYFFGPLWGWCAGWGVLVLWMTSGARVPGPCLQTALAALPLIAYGALHIACTAASPYHWKTWLTWFVMVIGVAIGVSGILYGARSWWRQQDTDRALVLTLLLGISPLGFKFLGRLPFRHRVDGGFFGAVLMAVGLSLIQEKERRLRVTGWPAVGLGVASLVIARSRAGLLLSSFLVLFVFGQFGMRGLKRRGAPRWVLRALWTVLLGLITMTGGFLAHWTRIQGPMALARWSIWRSEMRFILHHPWGVGLGHAGVVLPSLSPPQENPPVRYEKLLEHPHEQYLGFLIELGWPAVFFLAAVLYVGFRQWRAVSSPLIRRLTAYGGWVILGWGMFHDLTSYQLQIGVAALGIGLLWAFSESAHSPRRLSRGVGIACLIFYLSCFPVAWSLAETGWGRTRMHERPDSARIHFRRALRVWRENAWAHAGLADLAGAGLRGRTGSALRLGWMEVLHHRWQAVAAAPGERRFLNAWAHALMNFCRFTRERWACRFADRALGWYLLRVPQDVFAWYARANLPPAENRPEAQKYLQTALFFEPNFARAEYALWRFTCSQSRGAGCRSQPGYFQNVRSRRLETPMGPASYEVNVLRIPPVATLLHDGWGDR